MIFSENPHLFKLELLVNGEAIKREVKTHIRLLDFLRDDLRLTGTKEVCSEGECGACTVKLDGKTVNSCMILAVEAHGCEIVTIEGFSIDDKNRDLIDSFTEKHAVQCGYCIPGMVISGEQILREYDSPSREEIKEGLAGNICRCTGYHKIIDAIENVQRGD